MLFKQLGIYMPKHGKYNQLQQTWFTIAFSGKCDYCFSLKKKLTIIEIGD
jgi:hypothetical protein